MQTSCNPCFAKAATVMFLKKLMESTCAVAGAGVAPKTFKTWLTGLPALFAGEVGERHRALTQFCTSATAVESDPSQDCKFFGMSNAGELLKSIRIVIDEGVPLIWNACKQSFTSSLLLSKPFFTTVMGNDQSQQLKYYWFHLSDVGYRIKEFANRL